METLKSNLGIIVFVIVIIAFLAWFGLSDSVADSGLLEKESVQDISPEDREVLKVLLDLTSIRIDSGIFENPAFSALRDFGREVLDEPKGRSNPFEKTESVAEIEAAAATAAAAAASSVSSSVAKPAAGRKVIPKN